MRARQSPLDDGESTPTQSHKQNGENGSRRARFPFFAGRSLFRHALHKHGAGLRLCLAHLQGLQKALRPTTALGLALGIQPGDGSSRRS